MPQDQHTFLPQAILEHAPQQKLSPEILALGKVTKLLGWPLLFGGHQLDPLTRKSAK